ncbi:MAG: DUF2971 domain-containing protein [Eubacterium sp.]|nr:DUF2971 domain-containing protein [Eubacterium sp.]
MIGITNAFSAIMNDNLTPQIPLFKYYPNVNYAKDALINNRIHLEKLSSYNDIYDGTYIVDEEKLLQNKASVETICNTLKEKSQTMVHPIIDSFRDQVMLNKNTSYQDFFDYAEGFLPKEYITYLYFQCLQEGFSDKSVWGTARVSCFSEIKDSLLMWAYYGNNHKGVCLEFKPNTNNRCFQFCQKVQYTPNFFSNKDDNGLYFRKSTEWQHEQEWRMVLESHMEYFTSTFVDAIYIGVRTPKKEVNDLVKIAVDKKIDVYKTIPDTSMYKLNFTKIVDKGNIV